MGIDGFGDLNGFVYITSGMAAMYIGNGLKG